MTTKILRCNCNHAYQDNLYGVGNRVHNFAPKGFGNSPGWRCTVCGNVKSAQPRAQATADAAVKKSVSEGK